MSSKKTRETNIEILRIISILLIICFHYVYKSNYHYSELNLNTILVKSIWFLGELGVNVFILITGYYLSKSKASIRKVVLLILEVMFYNILLCFIGNIINVNTFIGSPLILFPIILSRYWFVTCYILIYILSPFYNILINCFNKRSYQKFLIITIFIWCIIPTFFGVIYNNTEMLLFYNRFIWLTIMYFIGAYIRNYGIKFFVSKKTSLLTFGVTYFSMVLSIFVIYLISKNGAIELAYLWTPNNVLMLILSISMFMFFKELKIKSNKVINKLATTTLGIYLLHDGPLASNMWKNIFHNDIVIYTDIFIIHILGSAFTIFAVGVIIDFIRQIIEKYTVRKILDLKIWGKLYSDLKTDAETILDKYV